MSWYSNQDLDDLYAANLQSGIIFIRLTSFILIVWVKYQWKFKETLSL